MHRCAIGCAALLGGVVACGASAGIVFEQNDPASGFDALAVSLAAQARDHETAGASNPAKADDPAGLRFGRLDLLTSPPASAVDPLKSRGLAMPGDTNGDFRVDQTDLQTVLDHFSDAGGLESGDVDGDGFVTFSDLNIVLTMFGAAIPAPSSAVLLASCGISLATSRRRR